MCQKKIRIVNGRLGLSGENIVFENECFFGLNVDQYIIQIGDGKENGCVRTDKFKIPIKYAGSIICDFNKPEKMFAFQLPEKINNENIYLLYGSTGIEIFTESVLSKKRRSSYVRFYKPFFI